MIPCKLGLKSTKFSDKTIITYEIELPPSGKKVIFNLLDDEYFTTPYITDTILNSPAGHKIPSQAKQHVYIIANNEKEPITSQCMLYELNSHQNTREKSNIKIILCRRKRYQRTDREEICYIFDKVRPVVSHLEVRLPKKNPTQNNIGEGLKCPQIQFWK